LGSHEPEGPIGPRLPYRREAGGHEQGVAGALASTRIRSPDV